MGVRPALVVLAVVATAGCTQGGTHVRAGGPPDAGRSTSASPQPGAGWQPPAGSKPVAQPVGYALVAADGRRITVSATGGGCTVDAHLEASEDGRRVALRLLGYESEGKDVTCPANLILWTRTVTLHSPVGERRLLDASTGKTVPYFDGSHLAGVRWLPPGAGRPADRPTGRGWGRTYSFPTPSAAPIEIDQVYGAHLDDSQFQPNPMLRVQRLRVHGRPARLVTQVDSAGRLLQARLGWVEHGFTFTVASMPERLPQQPFTPRVLERVAAGLLLG